MGIATLLAPKKYNVEEKEAGKAAILMGCVGITEGAIPFAANDPLRVIPSLIVGAVVGNIIPFLAGDVYKRQPLRRVRFLRQESRDSSCQMMRWKWESGSMESLEPTGNP